MKFISKSIKDTQEFASEFAKDLKPGAIVLLKGDLGAGKTTFVKYVVKSLGSKDLVTSPTFTLLNEYNAKVAVYHFDMYRLKDGAEAVDCGLDEILRKNDGVCFVEWPEKVKSILPKNCYVVNITSGTNGERIFEVSK